ncbi:hypothetical protein TNCT_261401 [Trichonephila clavata]|uniref:Uncharacterized protein n=1 Tax=Trichonephila clavata TaxID=2740835 RepID=A0A8X6HNM5_TRICU|nr:hypothetical protein TNCT_261401 [Trichonephila clavata]
MPPPFPYNVDKKINSRSPATNRVRRTASYEEEKLRYRRSRLENTCAVSRFFQRPSAAKPYEHEGERFPRSYFFETGNSVKKERKKKRKRIF